MTVSSPLPSTLETTAHVLRRLGIGANPQLLAEVDSPEAAITRALDLSAGAIVPPPLEAPDSLDDARDQEIPDQGAWWVDRMTSSDRLIEERMVWFWMDHFATSRRKVPANYLLWQQHLTIRDHALGSFAELLQAMAVEPAMLFYLDGISNEAENLNENFAREVMELYSLGVGGYSQTDIEEAARAFAGWVVNVPGTRYSDAVEGFGIGPWSSGPVPFRADRGRKTILGVTADHDMASAIDVLLEHDATAEHIANKLYRDLVGLTPGPQTVTALAAVFRADYHILALVEAIVELPAFTSAASIRTKVRSPLEKAMTLVQAFPEQQDLERVSGILRMTGYIPFLPPNPAGYPKGGALLGPYQLTHALDLLWLAPRNLEPLSTADALMALGVVDVTPETAAVMDHFPDPHSKLAIALASPEFVLT